MTSTYANVLGAYAKLKLLVFRFLKANSPKANSASPSGLARAVAVVVVSLCMGISLSESADSTSIDSIDPKTYIRLNYVKSEALCLIKLYGKESAFNREAIGNEDGIKKAYGIPQLKNPIIKDLSANKQIDYGMKYIDHRYQGSPCLAWAHSREHGWY